MDLKYTIYFSKTGKAENREKILAKDLPKCCCIYCCENITTGKKYIGQAKNFKSRWYGHNRNRINYNYISHFYNAYNKDPDEFFWYIIKECKPEELDDLEIHYISLYSTTNKDFGYNINPGGYGNSRNVGKFVVSKENQPSKFVLFENVKEYLKEGYGLGFSNIKIDPSVVDSLTKEDIVEILKEEKNKRERKSWVFNRKKYEKYIKNPKNQQHIKEKSKKWYNINKQECESSIELKRKKKEDRKEYRKNRKNSFHIKEWKDGLYYAAIVKLLFHHKNKTDTRIYNDEFSIILPNSTAIITFEKENPEIFEKLKKQIDTIAEKENWKEQKSWGSAHYNSSLYKDGRRYIKVTEDSQAVYIEKS